MVSNSRCRFHSIGSVIIAITIGLQLYELTCSPLSESRLFYLPVLSTCFISFLDMDSSHVKQNGLSKESTDESGNERQVEHKMQLVWTNVFAQLMIHFIALYGITVASWSCTWITILSGE